MPVDYSKWDALELSDDSDIEVHPNVDKRSFIRAKQNQIHQERHARKHQIETLKYERQINDGLLSRIDKLMTALKSHREETDRNPDELVLRSLMESADPANDQPPKRPEGLQYKGEEAPTYSRMMATLIDQVKAEVDTAKTTTPENKYEAYITEVQSHYDKVADLQKQLLAKLAELEHEEGRKITSESIHTGFDSSFVNKAQQQAASDSGKTTPKPQKKETVVEVLNPNAAKQPKKKDEQQSSGADADIDSPEDEDEDVEASETGKKFADIKIGDYRKSLEFISKNPDLLAEKETDGLLVLGFNSQLAGKEDFARQCVHQALLLQYCRALGRDGVGLFFKRVTTPGHQAQKVFLDDVNSTYDRIRTRVREIHASGDGEEQPGGVEQIQLHAVDPNTTINITIPPKDANTPEEKHNREIFEAFPPGLQRALESGILDEVNKVLGKMSIEEAEEVVGQLSEGGMLSVEEQIIDATTEEGQAALKQFEEQERAAAAAEAQQYVEEYPERSLADEVD